MAYEWQNDPPENDGDYFYTGMLPDQSEEVILIAQVFTNPIAGERMAVALIPPGWRGDTNRTQACVHFGVLEKWTGQWSGPEYGLCCVAND